MPLLGKNEARATKTMPLLRPRTVLQNARNQGAKVGPNEHVWPIDSGVFQCLVYFTHSERARVFRAGITPNNS